MDLLFVFISGEVIIKNVTYRNRFAHQQYPYYSLGSSRQSSLEPLGGDLEHLTYLV